MNARSVSIATRFATAFPIAATLIGLQPSTGTKDKEHGRELTKYDAWLESKWAQIRKLPGIDIDRAWLEAAIPDAVAWAGLDPAGGAAALRVILRFESNFNEAGPSTVPGVHTATGVGQVTLDTHIGLKLAWPHAWNMIPWYGLCAAAATWKEKLRIAGGDTDRAWLGYTGEASTAASRIAAYNAARGQA